MSDNCDIGLPLTRYVLIKATLYLVLTLHIQSSLLTGQSSNHISGLESAP